MHEGDGFSAKTVGKSLFHCQNAAPAMVLESALSFQKRGRLARNGTVSKLRFRQAFNVRK